MSGPFTESAGLAAEHRRELLAQFMDHDIATERGNFCGCGQRKPCFIGRYARNTLTAARIDINASVDQLMTESHPRTRTADGHGAARWMRHARRRPGDVHAHDGGSTPPYCRSGTAPAAASG
jgi:hypothetical protein